jgi:hypothetical protein
MIASCEHGKETSGTVTDKNFVQMHYYQLLKKDSAARI